MKNTGKLLLMIIGFVFITIFIINVNAATASTTPKDNMTYDQCYQFQDSSVSTSGGVFIAKCMKVSCLSGKWTLNPIIFDANIVKCTNGNTNPDYSDVNSACTNYTSSPSCSTMTPKYCGVVTYYDCNKVKGGGTFSTTNKTTSITSTTTKTTTKKTTPRKTSSKNSTTKTTTTTIPVAPSSNAYLSSLTVAPGTINFDREATTYTLEVEKTGIDVAVTALPEDEKAVVKIENNKAVNPEVPILITVTAQDGSTRTYTINIKVMAAELDDNAKLSKLEIKDYTKALSFDPEIYSYTLTIKKETSLNITVETESTAAEYSISGNVKLKDKSQIKIKVTAENGHEETYIINIQKSSSTSIVSIIIVLIVLAVAGFVGFKLIRGLFGNKAETGDTSYEYE